MPRLPEEAVPPLSVRRTSGCADKRPAFSGCWVVGVVSMGVFPANEEVVPSLGRSDGLYFPFSRKITVSRLTLSGNELTRKEQIGFPRGLKRRGVAQHICSDRVESSDPFV